MFKRYIGDKAFYRRVMAIAVPIIIQNGITNFVSLLDNIMVGQVGSAEMSGVSIVNQLMLVFNLCVFGVASGAGIFTAQFYGSQDHEGIRHTFRFKLLGCTVITALGITLFLTAGRPLIGLYLQGEGDPENAARMLHFGFAYLTMILFGLLPFALCNAYASTLRECGQTVVPMVGGICAVIVNLVLNYLLIFGHCGLPRMGVRGAALATVVSRYVELAIVACWTHCHSQEHPFIRGAYRSFRIPVRLLRRIAIKAAPLLCNEFMWAAGIAFLNQCYSTCGLDVVPATNIASTITNLSSVVALSLGNTVGIIMGRMLGAGHGETEVRDSNRKLLALGIVSGVVFGALLASISGVFPHLYNTPKEVRDLATWLILISAVLMPVHAYLNAAYFTLRSGGKTGITFLFDSGFVWMISIPLAFVLSRFTDVAILPLYILCQGMDIIKCAVGYVMLRKGSWIQNLTVK